MSDQFDATNAPVLEATPKPAVKPEEENLPDIGSSIFIPFTPKFNATVVAISKEDLLIKKQVLYKLPCGKVEYRDIPGPESAEFKNLGATLYGGNALSHEELVKAVASGERLDYRDPAMTNEDSPEYQVFLATIARTCALRELKSETGIDEDEFLHIGQLAYTRPIHKWDKEKKQRKFLRQFHFFGILERQSQLSVDCGESTEMGDPEYWDPVDVLKWDVPLDRKVNPFHRIAFARCLIELRDQGVAEAIPEFAALLKRVNQAGQENSVDEEKFTLDTYEEVIRKLMKNRDPRT